MRKKRPDLEENSISVKLKKGQIERIKAAARKISYTEERTVSFSDLIREIIEQSSLIKANCTEKKKHK